MKEIIEYDLLRTLSREIDLDSYISDVLLEGRGRLRFSEVFILFWRFLPEFAQNFHLNAPKTLTFVLNYCTICMPSIKSQSQWVDLGAWSCLLWSNSMILGRSIEYFDRFWPILASLLRLRVPNFLIIIMVNESERLRVI